MTPCRRPGRARSGRFRIGADPDRGSAPLFTVAARRIGPNHLGPLVVRTPPGMAWPGWAAVSPHGFNRQKIGTLGMHDFFKVTELEQVLGYRNRFVLVPSQPVDLIAAVGRILATDVTATADVPGFDRSTMDGYAVQAQSTFGASEANPAYLTLTGQVEMGQGAPTAVGLGEAVRIPTGGMLPESADSVVMVEHTAELDDASIEVYRSVAPGQHVIRRGEDIASGARLLRAGCRLRPQEVGLLAALGHESATVYRRPRVAVISTGDEIVPVDRLPGPGQVRDINSFSLSAQIVTAGGLPLPMGIVADRPERLEAACNQALRQADMVLLSGGSSVGTRDYTVDILQRLPQSEILVHGIPISPGKPTILATVGRRPVWGLPGHAVSAMVVFQTVVQPFLFHIAGRRQPAFSSRWPVWARLNRNLSSSPGRTEYVRVRLFDRDGEVWAEPVLGKSGLIRTMVAADGLVTIEQHTEGLAHGSRVSVLPLSR
jgi:molybdopterin molybdotransferase